jgi:hypothetical protein
MNKIHFKLERAVDVPIIRDAISFSNIAFINPIVDGKSLFESEDFADSFMVYEELIKTKGSGKYLLFTCACGVADDGGWNGVNVEKNNTVVKWEIDKNTHSIKLTFDVNQYEFELEKLISEVSNLSQNISLEPTNVNFPEEW